LPEIVTVGSFLREQGCIMVAAVFRWLVVRFPLARRPI
jgi:hypothetical protein